MGWISDRIGQAEKAQDRNVTLLPYDRHPAYHERFHAGLEGYTASGERIGQVPSRKRPERSESSTTTDFFHLFYNRVFHLLNSRDAVHDSESEDEVEPSEIFSHNVKDATSTSKLAVLASEPFEASKDDPLAQFYDQQERNMRTRLVPRRYVPFKLLTTLLVPA